MGSKVPKYRVAKVSVLGMAILVLVACLVLEYVDPQALGLRSQQGAVHISYDIGSGQPCKGHACSQRTVAGPQYDSCKEAHMSTPVMALLWLC